jgi:hypothetical protein
LIYHLPTPLVTFLLAAQLLAQDPKTAIIQLPPSIEVTGTMLADIDGDKLTDLVLACHHTTTGQRSLRVHSRQKSGPAFASKPSRAPYQLDSDAIAFTFCDCTDAPGQELILLSAERIALVVTEKNGERDYQPVGSHVLIWPAADDQRIVPLRHAAVDFDNDGREDLLLPHPNGWSVWFQDQAGGKPTFTRHADTTLPRRQSSISKAMGGRGAGGDSNGFQLRFGGGKSTGADGLLVRTSTRTPQCKALDLNGDGKLDLVAQRNGSMHAAMQTTAGKLTAKEQPLPLPENRLKVLDPAFNVQWPDVNGDGHADLLLTTSAQRDGAVEARVDLFLADRFGAWSDKPDCRLRMQTLANAPQVLDVDGDGKAELVCVTLRTSAMSALTNPKAASFDAQLNIYDFEDGKFTTPSMLSRPMPLMTDTRLKKPFLIVRPGRRGRAGDVLLHINDRVERRFLNAKNKQLTLASSDASSPVPPKSRILVADEIGDDILIVTGNEVRHVRFRR